MLRALVVLLAATPAFAGVRTVAPQGADHAQIASALAAALPGDVVLVRAGTYAPFAIDGFGVTVLADAGANVVVQGPVAVRNVPSGACVVLAGVRVGATNTTAITVEDCAGSVRLVDAQAWVAPNVVHADLPAMRVERCADVALSRTTLSGPASPFAGVRAGPALRARDTVLSVHDATLTGGHGLSGASTGSAGGHGADALEVEGGALFLSGARLVGGSGGAGGLTPTGHTGCSAYAPRVGGSGGAGLDVAAGSTARVLDCAISGGSGGSGATTNCGQHAADGVDGASTLGVVTAVAGGARVYVGDASAREGGRAVFDLRGAPGERVFLFLAHGAGQSWNGALGGTVLVRVPFWRRVLVAAIGADGRGTASLPVPELGQGQTARILHAQALFVDPAGGARLGAARPLVLLDSAY